MFSAVSKVFGSRRVCAFQRAFPRSFDPLPELPKAGTCKVVRLGSVQLGLNQRFAEKYVTKLTKDFLE